MPVPALTLRLEKASPLTALEGDNDFRSLRDFANAQEAFLGVSINPDGTVKSPLVLYGASASATDEYVISVAYTATAYADFVGKVVLLKADVANAGPTTPATLKINPLTTAIAIKKYKDQELSNGDIKAGQIAELTYDGTFFQLHNPSTAPPINYFADDGTDAAYRINLATNPVGNFSVPYAYYAGYKVSFKAANANPGAATLQVMSPAVTLAPVALQLDGLALSGGEIAAGQIVEAIHDGSVWQIVTGGRKQRYITTVASYQAIPATNTVVTFAHGLGVVPDWARLTAVCTDAGGDGTFVLNDEVDLLSNHTSSTVDWSGVGIITDATNITASWVWNTYNLRYWPKSGAVATFAMDHTKWKLKARAGIF